MSGRPTTIRTTPKNMEKALLEEQRIANLNAQYNALSPNEKAKFNANIEAELAALGEAPTKEESASVGNPRRAKRKSRKSKNRKTRKYRK